MERLARRKSSANAEVTMTPMIDLVFLLLIFFLVTTSFTRETGLEIARPMAATAEQQEPTTILLAVDAEGQIFLDRERVDIRTMRGRIVLKLAEHPQASAVVIADKHATVEQVVALMDQCRLAGVQQVSIAAKAEQ
ncbi:ExbD/TolR family protein [Chrysiogenes arsenatis]|uniref:ExbD/TolR family protein n=1 Tax=Chrysiogenes arsenatis TaxID=309797 RepID=UPI000424F2B9|nr:biopolymer transporter ExbD [Chrysiogenes arsenatis]